MNAILGYGEDALTFHALSNGRASMLRQLDDDNDPERCVVFFRPSCGRGRGSFGEFDWILGTPKAVYLGETKWGRRNLTLKPAQRTRHKIFRLYRDHWCNEPWPDFAQRITPVLAQCGRQPPVDRTDLAKNLRFILQRLDKCGSQIVDVLLFCQLSSDSRQPPKSCEPTFQMITYKCPVEDNSNFFRLEPSH